MVVGQEGEGERERQGAAKPEQKHLGATDRAAALPYEYADGRKD
jgi:hypothetical protein